MVLYWLFEKVCAFFVWAAGTLPTVPVPSWITDTGTWQGWLTETMEGLAPWVPLKLVTAVAAVYVVCLLASLALKVGRIVASFLTLGGGSAA